MLVTIGIPFYNNEKTILDAIRSVFAQTYTNWELILVDDASTDISLEKVKSISDPRIKVIHDGKRRGLPYRLNQISKMAKGQYIARMDADDLMSPERIKEQMNFMKMNVNVDVIGTMAYIMDDNKAIVGISRELNCDHITVAYVLQSGLFIHPSVLGKTEWFRKHLYNEGYMRGQDHELWVRTFIESSNFSNINLPLMYYRVPSKLNLNNYLISGQTERGIFRTYGPKALGIIHTKKLIIRSFIKGIVYRLYKRLGIETRLMNKRYLAIEPLQKMTGEKTILFIKQIKLPSEC